MLVIRLKRTGRRNQAKFRIVLQEKSQAPRSAAKEILGSYDPHLAERKDQIQLKADRIQYWISVGAQPSATVHNILVEQGVIEGEKKRVVQPKKKEGEETEEAAPAEGASEETPAEAEAETKEDDSKEEAAE